MNDVIDWRRVAEPQVDGYDIGVMRQHLNAGLYGKKFAKPLPDGATLIWNDGRARFIRMTDYAAPSPDLQEMPWNDPLVKEGLAQLEHWPAVLPLVKDGMIALCPLTVGRVQLGHGCTCGNYGDDWGWIYVTADNAWGLAEGLVHEMGHWKLRAFGVWFEDWTDLLLLNKPTELYVSPVRKDIERPMGAVLHAQYSYVHVAEMCNRMLKATAAPRGDDIDWTALQIRRITEGLGTLRTHARGTPEVGAPFLTGLDDWTARVIAEGTQIVTSLGGKV